jgi:hypothetical protein
LFWMVSNSATVPDWPHIRLNINQTNTAEPANDLGTAHGSQAISASGTQTISGISPAMTTGQWLYVAQLDSGNNPSTTSAVQR